MMSVYAFEILNKLIDYHQTWHQRHANAGHHTLRPSHFLKSQLVVKWNVYRNKVLSLADRKKCRVTVLLCHVLQYILLNSQNLSFFTYVLLIAKRQKRKQSIYYLILHGFTVVYRSDRHYSYLSFSCYEERWVVILKQATAAPIHVRFD